MKEGTRVVLRGTDCNISLWPSAWPLCPKKSTFSGCSLFRGPPSRHLGSIQSQWAQRPSRRRAPQCVCGTRVSEFTCLYFCDPSPLPTDPYLRYRLKVWKHVKPLLWPEEHAASPSAARAWESYYNWPCILWVGRWCPLPPTLPLWCWLALMSVN